LPFAARGAKARAVDQAITPAIAATAGPARNVPRIAGRSTLVQMAVCRTAAKCSFGATD
jgi:hypothetical protein